MPLNKSWREVHRLRFPDLPLDCGNDDDPGIIYSEDLRDWSDKATTPDQYRMEDYIDRYDLRSKTILHIGIGNSGLARRFHCRVKEIVGTTIDQPEMDVAKSLGIQNYRHVIHNKFLSCNEPRSGLFDFILDNNPTSPCCCIRHLATLFDFYAAKLADDGQIVTDRLGLEWVPEDSNQRWSFSFDDLAAVAASSGLSAFRFGDWIYVLSRSAPIPPTFASMAHHLGRKASKLPRQLVKKAPPAMVRAARGCARRVLEIAAPTLLEARRQRSEAR